MRFIFYAYTTFQLFSAAYYAVKVKWSEGTEKCLVWYKYDKYTFDISFLRPYFDEIIEISDPGASLLPVRELKRSIDGGYLFRLSKVGRYISGHRNNNVLVCFSDQNEFVIRTITFIKKYQNNIVCMVEEGDATYAFPKFEEPPIHKRIARMIMGVKMGRYIGHTGQIDCWVVRHPELLPNQKVGASKVIKQNDIFINDEWSRRFSFLWADQMPSANSLSKKKILWIGGPIDVDGVSNAEEISWLKDIADAFQNDYVIWIKQHPREEAEKFSPLAGHPAVQIVSKQLQWIPLEFFVNSVQPDIILTVSSSAAYHIYEMGFQGKVIYTHKRFDGIHIDRNVIEQYARHINIYDVGNLEELRHVVHDVALLPREMKKEQNTNQDIRYFEELMNVTDSNDKQ